MAESANITSTTFFHTFKLVLGIDWKTHRCMTLSIENEDVKASARVATERDLTLVAYPDEKQPGTYKCTLRVDTRTFTCRLREDTGVMAFGKPMLQGQLVPSSSI